MKSYFQIQVFSTNLAGTRGASPGPVGTDLAKISYARLPGSVGDERWKPSENRLLEETIAGGSITLELDNRTTEWRMTPPAFAHWKFYLPSTYGRWARSGDEITIRDASNKEIYFSLRQANKMSGHAFHKLSFTGRHQFPTEWKRVPKPLPVSSVPPIWYGLAIAGKGGTATGRVATAIALSDSDWFTFYMPSPTTGTFRGYSWTSAFVLLTVYL